MEEQTIKQKQRQEVIFQTQIPQVTTAPNTKVVEIPKSWEWERLVLMLFWGHGVEGFCTYTHCITANRILAKYELQTSYF